MENLDVLINELCKQPNETEWLEFKCSNFEPDTIGRDISALANSAVLQDRDKAYMLWGVDDKTHVIVGTKTNQFSHLVGSQEIESWLRLQLSRNIELEFDNTTVNGLDVVLLTICRAKTQPITFKKDAYIRIGSYTKRINEYPGMEAKLWDKLRIEKFEELTAKEGLRADEVFSLLSIPSYFDLLHMSNPESSDYALHYLLEDKLIVKNDNGMYSITNLGALLFAKRLTDFPSLRRKAVRVLVYEDDSKYTIKKQYEGTSGYAVGFESIIQFLDATLPSEEVITSTVRETKRAFPPVAIREILSNALIHQDLTMQGTSPLIEVFPKRIEITNPGRPIIDINRFVDNPPRSRNEALASLMRRLGFCEEAGSGWDRVLIECEMFHIPAPLVEVYEENTKITFFSEVSFSNLKFSEKCWTCYMHSCLNFVTNHEGITNSSLRKRFGLAETMSAQVSRLLKKVVEKGFLKPFDPEADTRHQKYVPYWA